MRAPFLNGAREFEATNQQRSNFFGVRKEKIIFNQQNNGSFSLSCVLFCVLKGMLRGLACFIMLWMNLGSWESTKKNLELLSALVPFSCSIPTPLSTPKHEPFRFNFTVINGVIKRKRCFSYVKCQYCTGHTFIQLWLYLV